MAETDRDYRQFAGRVNFPRNPADLTNVTQCPACFSQLVSPICAVCGLDLTHPIATELAAVSAQVAGLLDDRLGLIGHLRFDADRAHAAAAAPSAPGTPANATAAPATQISTEAPPVAAEWPLLPLPPGPPTHTSPPSTPPAVGVPRRSSIQVILLIVGVSLLSIAAIFFLVYAFINYGIVVRGLIVAAVTVATVAVATVLRRRALPATAEGIAVFAIVLVYLDAYAVRAGDYFGLAASDGSLFWGWTLIVTGAGFVAWHRISALRTPSVVGFAAIAPGVGLLVAGLDSQADWASRTFFAFAAIALAGLVQVLARRSTTSAILERSIVLATSLVGFAVAAPVAIAIDGSEWLSAIAFLGLAVIALLHVAALRPQPDDRMPTGVASLFAGVAAFLAASAVGAAALHSADATFGVIAPVVAATVIAFGCELAAQRMTGAAAARHARVAAFTAGGVAGLVALFPFFVALTAVTSGLSTALAGAWTLSPTDALVESSGIRSLAVVALVLIGLIAVLSSSLAGRLQKRSPALLWFAGIVVILAVGLLSITWLVLAGWSAVSAATIVLLVRTRGGLLPAAYRSPLVVVAALAGSLAYLSGWASTGTWLIGSIVAIALLLAGRSLSSSGKIAAALLSAACVLILIGGAAAARDIAIASRPNAIVDLVNSLRGAGIAATALFALCAGLPLRVLSATTLDRRSVFWISGAVAGGSAVVGQLALGSLSGRERSALLLPEDATSLTLSLTLFGVLVLWLARQNDSALRWERAAASVALGPTIWWIANSFVLALGLGGFAAAVAPMAGVVLAGALSLAITFLRPGIARWARELGIAIVAAPTLAIAVTAPNQFTWLVLVLAAVSALLLSVSSDGLFASRSPRRYLGWLALALATGGVWWRLGDDRVQQLEPFVLPLSAALLVIAALLWHAGSTQGSPNRAAPPVALAGMLVAILPIGLEATAGPLPRAIAVAAVSALLLLAGSFIAGRRAQPYLDAAAAAGAIGIVVVSLGRAVTIINEPGRPDLRLDAWLIVAVALLVAAAFGQAGARHNTTRGATLTGGVLRTRASVTLGLIAMTSLLVFEPFGFAGGGLGAIRAFGVVLVFCALHVIAFAASAPPFTRLLGWISIAWAAISVAAGLFTGAFDPPELGTIPIAVALLCTGALVLSTSPTARTWAWLAPGVLVLLVPSLVATAWDDPVWRLVGLGVVAIAIVVIGAVRRLQAPFLIAVVVTLIHAIATLAPQIRAIYQAVEWWVWLAIGGGVIVVLAARFERSMRAFRSVAMRVKALR